MNKLVLGTVQFGLKYGINHQSKPDLKEIEKIALLSVANKIPEVDTAEIYGNALEILSEIPEVRCNQLKIVTKVTLENSTFLKQLELNLIRLKSSQIYGCYLHSFNDLNSPQLFNQVAQAKEEGKIKKFGVSIYTESELEECISLNHVDIIQIPFNIFDQSQKKLELLLKAKEKSKTIYTRSVFLQGLFFMDPEKLPLKLQNLKVQLSKLQFLSKKSGIELSSLCLKYVIDQPNIDHVIIGVENCLQLSENLKALDIEIPQDLMEELKKLNIEDRNLINPAMWNK